MATKKVRFNGQEQPLLPQQATHEAHPPPPYPIVGDEYEQLFVLERLTVARKEMKVHGLSVPDIDAVIICRLNALERIDPLPKQNLHLPGTATHEDRTSNEASVAGQAAIPAATAKRYHVTLPYAHLSAPNKDGTEMFGPYLSVNPDTEQCTLSGEIYQPSGETYAKVRFRVTAYSDPRFSEDLTTTFLRLSLPWKQTLHMDFGSRDNLKGFLSSVGMEIAYELGLPCEAEK